MQVDKICLYTVIFLDKNSFLCYTYIPILHALCKQMCLLVNLYMIVN